MREDNTLQFQDLDQVFQNAHLRRSTDLGGWLREYFAARRARRQDETNLLDTGALRRQAV